MRSFYERVLPAQGVYCAAGIDTTGRVLNVFASSLNELLDYVDQLREAEVNVFVAPGSFVNHSRRAENSAFLRSFFIDLDVGDTKPYTTREEAIVALDQFLDRTGLPPPILVNSGNGAHAYWAFDEDVAAAQWKPYAKKFKEFCLEQGLHIDPVVTADAARIMRCPDTLNYKSDPPLPTSLVGQVIQTYSWESFKEFLGDIEPDVLDILRSVPKGLDDETKKFLKTNNFETTFESIAVRSLEADGCAQIKVILEQAPSLLEPVWYAGLSIARHCDDWETAIHLMSEDHPEYTYARTLQKAEQTVGKPQSCGHFDSINPGVCSGCPHRGKITNPLALGRRLKQADTSSLPLPPAATTQGEDPFKASVHATTPQAGKKVPDAASPYFIGVNGGVYYVPPPTVDKDGNREQDPPFELCQHNFYPIKRMFSAVDGECMMMRLELPHDANREFLLPIKDLYLADRFKEIVGKNGVLFKNNPQVVQLVMEYVNRWGRYLINLDSAEQMRMQMGWTEGRESFVIGNIEIKRDGKTVQTASSPFVRGISKLLKPYGTYATWQASANALNEPNFEIFAFGLLLGFGSPLMCYTSTSGGNVCFCGETGAGKTGTIYGALSIWGHPKDLSVFDATDNGMIGRYLGLKNLPLGCDEASNKRPDQVSNLIHRVSHGKAKIRMQASVNAEREQEMSASLINILTSNQSLYDKLVELKANPEGEAARLIEFNVVKPPQMMLDDRLGVRIFNQFNHHYGYAGQEFIKHIYKVGDDHVEELIKRWSDKFLKDFGGDTAYRFYENIVAASFAGGELANEAGIVNYDLERIYNVILVQILAIKNHTMQLHYNDYEGLVSQYIHHNESEILIMNNDRVVQEPRTKLMARSEIHTGTLYVPKAEFKKFLSDIQVASRQFEKALEKSNILVFNSKKRMSAGWKAGTDFLAPVNAYGFKLNSVDDVIKPPKLKP